MFIRTEKAIYSTMFIDLEGDNTVIFKTAVNGKKVTLKINEVIYITEFWPTKKQDKEIGSIPQIV